MENGNRGRKGWIEGAHRVAWLIAIVFASVSIGVGLSWRMPELDSAARDWLVRSRGKIAPPPEIAIIAIDEVSIARLGRFPWPRALMARGLELISASRPKVIALDVLYSEPTMPADDQALATAIARAGNVVVASQLTRTTGDNGESGVVWLRPLPEIASAAAGVGHVNVVPSHDGIVRALLLRQADDGGAAVWAMAAEAARVADRNRGGALRESPGAAQIGAHRVPVYSDGDEIILGAQNDGARFERLRPARLHIDYVGPGGSFAGQTYSFSDLLEGKIGQDKLRDKYVLIGATAAALGDRVATPFAYAENDPGLRADELTPGIEVLANSLSTILRERFYRELPDWLMISLTSLSAMSVYLSLTLLQGRREGVKQIAAMVGSVSILLLTAYFAFTRWLIILPLVPVIAAGVTAAMLSLLRRSLAVSAGLDARISELALWDSRPSDEGTLSSPLPNAPTRVIARLSGAEAAAILSCGHGGERRLVASYGAAFRRLKRRTADREAAYSASQELSQDEPASDYFDFNGNDHSVNRRAMILRLEGRPGDDGGAVGELILAYAARPANETLALCREIAASFLAADLRTAPCDEANSAWRRLSHLNWWPRGAAWKAQALAWLQHRMIARSLFVERALRSIEDGLLITTADGRITFANPRAAAILGMSERGLIGGDLFERLSEGEQPRNGTDPAPAPRETLFRLLVERSPVEREITIHAAGHARPRQYILRMSAVSQGSRGAPGTASALGIVATFSDVTKQHELQKAKNDVMALVSHELRTPLTAIQGISEVLTKYEVEPQRRYEMHLAINDESKRLARMIDEYLDLTRLETGARPLRLESLCVTQLLDRALLLLEPVAAQREIRVIRRFAPNLPALTADADLIARAVTNLLANAVKFSHPRHDVVVEAFAERDFLRIEVKDQGCGIPPEAIPFIFEKFYRAPRLPPLEEEEADAPGVGMGLAFVRDIAQLHGGRITVESEVGVGSVFTLRLPFIQERFDNSKENVFSHK
jgi:two-component system, OmpR family, sensor histidine kinase ResE